MHTIIRRARAALSLAVLWGAATGAVGLLIGVATVLQRNRYPVLPDVALWWLLSRNFLIGFAEAWAAGGALIALGFAAVLQRTERGRAAHTLSPSRFALWGALAGGGIFLAWWLAVTHLRAGELAAAGFPLASLLTSIALGAGYAWLTLRLARRSPTHARPEKLRDGSWPEHDVLPPGDLLGVRREADARVETT